jgi:hypothetical protein
MFNKSILATLLLVATASPVLADQSPDWNSVEFAYVKSEYKEDAFEGYEPEGFYLNGTLAITSNIFTEVRHLSTGDKLTGITGTNEVTTGTTSLGIGFYHPVNASTDWFTSASFVKGATDLGPLDDKIDSDGYILRVGVRSMLYPDIEIGMGIIHQDVKIDGIEENEAETGFELRSHINFTDNVDISLGFNAINDINTMTVGFRFRFK